MKNLIALISLLLWLAALTGRAQDQAWEIETLSPKNEFVYDLRAGSATGTNGVIIKYGGAVMTAERVTLDQKTGEAVADGNVRIQRDDQLWVGEHVNYNFKTRSMSTAEFRTGKPPVFAVGHSLSGDDRSQVYTATNTVITTDDYSEPAVTIRTRKLKIVPGKYLEARHALLYLEGVPVFYLPYYRRNLGDHANNFNLIPGYSSSFGPFLLGSYTWYWQEELDGALRLDYRLKRGVGGGPDLNYHLGRWGDGTISYYYMHDQDPNADNQSRQSNPADRQRVYFSYLAGPATNLTVRSQVRYQSDPYVNSDFFEGEYRHNPQPSTYLEVNKFWDNFSLDAYAQPRVNDFLETVERLPEIRLTGFRQQLGGTPFYYQSESSLVYLRRSFADTNIFQSEPDYAAMRADTYQQLLLPYTAFGWLNLTPRAGGRFTYYSDDTGPGGNNSEAKRTIFDTGIEASFKLSRTWPAATSKLLDVDGLRHIIEPSANYAYVPEPSHDPSSLPQFDYMIPSLQLRPLDFPEMNSIDGITSENTVRLGMRNLFQTKRGGELATLAKWEVFTDLHIDKQNDESRFSYVYSDLFFAPRNWLTFESEVQIDVANSSCVLAYHTVTFRPNTIWKWSLAHRYQRDDPELGVGNNVIDSIFDYRFNENWGVQLRHYFEARDGRMEEQYYTLFRDFRAWTSAFTFRVTDMESGTQNFTFAFTFSLKGYPRFGLGSHYSLIGQ